MQCCNHLHLGRSPQAEKCRRSLWSLAGLQLRALGNPSRSLDTRPPGTPNFPLDGCLVRPALVWVAPNSFMQHIWANKSRSSNNNSAVGSQSTKLGSEEPKTEQVESKINWGLFSLHSEICPLQGGSNRTHPHQSESPSCVRDLPGLFSNAESYSMIERQGIQTGQRFETPPFESPGLSMSMGPQVSLSTMFIPSNVSAQDLPMHSTCSV